MLTLIVPRDLVTRLEDALREAREREVGGVLLAEHVDFNTFKLQDLTIHKRGTFSSFVRRIEDAWTTLKGFFGRTAGNYMRFNYIGEWHSHPSFDPRPSGKDHGAMRDIVMDPHVGANFVVLLIVKLSVGGVLVGTVHTYLPDGQVTQSRLEVEQ